MRRYTLPLMLTCSTLALGLACADDTTDPSDDEVGDGDGDPTGDGDGDPTGDGDGDPTGDGDGDPTGDGDGDPTGDGDGDPTGDGDGDPTGDGDGDPTGDGDGDPTGDGDGDGDPCGPECCPDETQCDGANSLICNEDGTDWEILEVCDGVQGVTCDENFGTCEGACSQSAIGLSYIGCDYYPTVTQQQDGFISPPTNEFAVAVANVSDEDAMITVTRGPDMVFDTVVSAGTVEVITLPWVNELAGSTAASMLVVDGAYRLRSDRPVVVYQYNPLDATYTNDASILLPVNAWGPEYTVASWPWWQSFQYPGFYAIVAHEDETTVDLYPSATGGSVRAGGGVQANGTGQVVLDNSDVLQVIVNTNGDLTGTQIVADKPVQVISGHECTNVPLDIPACDHLEETMFPTQTLATEYIVAPPVQVPNDDQLKAQIVRVIATVDNTNVTFDPDQGQDQVLANAGDFIELPMSTAAYKVSADKEIIVVQYMVGQSANFGTSDPAMLLAVPTAQYRSDYLFHAAPTWQANYVDVIAPMGASVTVDGANVGGWTPIGNTDFVVAHVQLSNAGDGNHQVSANQDVGISVYGVQSFGSYWYPGGLDLEINPQ